MEPLVIDKIVNEESLADIIVINTCGFIDSAKEEAIQTILEIADYKQKRCKYLIVMGCLVQRYYEELKKLIPEVDLWIKIDEYDYLWEKIENLVKSNIVEKSKTNTSKQISKIPPMPMFEQHDFMNRTVTTGNNFAYLKIGEGCSNRCTYCAIPYIRGPFVSRKKEDIIEEAKGLAVAMQNFTWFFFQVLFVGGAGGILVQTTLAGLGYEVELIDLAAAEIPVALVALVVSCAFVILKDNKLMKKYYGKSTDTKK